MNKPLLYTLNSVCMLIVSSVLIGAFYFQYGLGENPCPLCLLQRMGMLGVILALGMNTFFGFSVRHFAMVILTSVVGASFSTRQVLLHIAPDPGEPLGYGSPFLGMHLYTWGVIIFVSCIIGSALFLFSIREETSECQRQATLFERGTFYLALVLCAGNVLATFTMCGLGPCCENGPCP